ncbi:MAG: 6-phosphogluconolactonase [Bdellovibrionales bacterium]|nr:6-phosphogluconolactonase [Bdellovibrionales bacterium]
MEIIVGKGLQDWVERADRWCLRAYTLDECRSFYLPAGNTPVPLYRSWEKLQPSFLGDCNFLQIDEILTGQKRGIFSRFFQTELPSLSNAVVPPNSEFIQADAAVLGLGKNGHLGFHEPGLPDPVYLACVSLDQITCVNLGLEHDSWGLTYGLGAFLRCRRVLLMVRGEEKREILEAILRDENSTPAAQLLRLHPQVTVLCDDQARPRN